VRAHGLEQLEEALHVGARVGARLLQRVAHARLRRQVDRVREAPLCEERTQLAPVAEVHVDDRDLAPVLCARGQGQGEAGGVRRGASPRVGDGPARLLQPSNRSLARSLARIQIRSLPTRVELAPPPAPACGPGCSASTARACLRHELDAWLPVRRRPPPAPPSIPFAPAHPPAPPVRTLLVS
jgi:hypothetical protein